MLQTSIYQMTSFKDTFFQHTLPCPRVRKLQNLFGKGEAIPPLQHLYSPWKKQITIVLKLADISTGKKASNPIYSKLKVLSNK